MSQLSQVATPSVGDRQEFGKLTWAEFVQIVLELTIQAYQAMLQDCQVSRDWEENNFTVWLGDNYLRDIAFDNDYSLRVEIRSKVHTPAMKEGQQATIEAKEMDLSLYGIWERDYMRKRFVWEAKRVGDKRLDPEYSKLNSGYVNEAIYRFIQREYADGLRDAGVLGYVLAGDVANIVSDINKSMGRIHRNPPLHVSNHLQMAPAIGQFRDIYRSNHRRTDNSSIQLYHLFLTFKFV